MRFAKARRKPGVMNTNESKYHAYLEGERIAGRVLWFAFELYKFQLAPRMYFAPDFAVLRADDILEFVDVKGRTTKKTSAGKVDTFFYMEDSKMKLKLAADKFPHPFKVAYQSRAGEWVHVTVLGEESNETEKENIPS